VDADGNPQHPGDMAAQLELSLYNLEAVLADADMTLANVVRLNVYTTDFDELVKHWSSLVDRFGPAATTFVRGSASSQRVEGRARIPRSRCRYALNGRLGQKVHGRTPAPNINGQRDVFVCNRPPVI
jgi:hypothetical protein